jgi:hypothetical protein
VLQVGEVEVPLTPGILTKDVHLFQTSLDMLRRPLLVPSQSGGPTEAGALEDLACLYDAAAFQSYSIRPATEVARLAILQEFMDDLHQRGRSMEQAQPADVVVYLVKWGKANGAYELDGKRYVAASSMQQRASHLKTILEQYPSCRGPWHASGIGKMDNNEQPLSFKPGFLYQN